MRHFARNNLLTPVFRLAERYGVTQHEILDEIDLDARLATRPGAFIHSEKLIDAVESAAILTRRSDFGLLLGPDADHRLLGPLRILMEQSESVAQGVREGIRYLDLHNTALHYALTPVRTNYVFALEILAQGAHPPRHYVEALLRGCTGFFRAMLGATWAPAAVRFKHKKMASPAAYRDAFGCDPTFEEDANGIVVVRRDFDKKIGRGDQRIRLATQQFLDDIERQKRNNLAGLVESFIRPLLRSGQATIAKVAALLSMTPRTLQRRLADEGTSFQQVLSQIRVEILRDGAPSRMSLTELAPLLGFSDATAVSRFVKLQTGASLSSQRARRK